MVSLPKGSPVVTGVPAAREAVPQFLARLSGTGFSGYAQYGFASAQAVLLFKDGKLISMVLARGEGRVSGLEALTELCHRVVRDDGVIDVYRLAPDLTVALSSLLNGDVILHGQEIKLLDVRSLTAKLKAQRFNGCIKVYTQTRTTLVFYKDGSGFGFFHDGSEVIEATASESQKIANLPGAKMDVLASRPSAGLEPYDLLEVVNLEKLWATAVKSHQLDEARVQASAHEFQRAQLDAKLTALEESLRAIAQEALGAVGKTLVAKELTARGGHACLLEPADVDGLLAAVDKGARLLAGPSRVRELIDRLRREIHLKLPAGKGGA